MPKTHYRSAINNAIDWKECTYRNPLIIFHNWFMQNVLYMGYFGIFCNASCPPGRFGKRCGGIYSSNCTAEYCNHVSECLLTTKTTTQMTSSGKGQNIMNLMRPKLVWKKKLITNNKASFSADPKVYKSNAWEDKGWHKLKETIVTCTVMIVKSFEVHIKYELYICDEITKHSAVILRLQCLQTCSNN